MKQGTTLSAIVVCVACAMPSVAMAETKRFDSTVKYTHIEDPQADTDPLLVGAVKSESPRCISGRKIIVTDETGGKVTKITDADGVFSLTLVDTSETLPGLLYDTRLRRKKFGSSTNRKLCRPDSATVTFDPDPVPTSINDFAFNPETNTFTGTLVSSDSRCVSSKNIGIFRADGQDPVLDGNTVSSQGGVFAYTPQTEPTPGSWSSIAFESGFVDFTDGDVLVGSCGSADSNDVQVGAQRASHVTR